MKFPTIFTMCMGLVLFALGCHSPKEVPVEKETAIPGKIMVLLDQGVQPTKLVKDLSSYQLKLENQISRSQPRFMFSFDANTVDSQKLIEAINNLSYASEAEIPQQTNR